MAKVSIITPCYNAQSFLAETYASIMSQTFTDWEWVVVDDCSSDDSWEMLQKFAKEDSRVKLFRNEKNSGVSASRNKGITFSEGSLIAFLDADDIWLPRKLELQTKWHAQGETFTFHAVIPFNDKKDFSIRKYKGKVNRTVLLKNNVIPTSSVMINAVFAKKHLFFETLSHGEDLLYFYAILNDSLWANGHEECLSKYRLSLSSLSKNKVRMAQNRWNIYRTYLKINLFESIYYFCSYTITGLLKTIR